MNLAETLGIRRKSNVVGAKGKSAFANIVNGLPLTAPVDYMHCVLMGVFQDLLKFCYKSLKADEKTKVNKILSELSCPRELVSYSRKIRSLEEISQFKANEYFNWLFYQCPIIFLEGISSELYLHLTNLVFAIRLLFDSSSEANSRKLLEEFCKEIVTVHNGNERMETINVHCLLHLADQVERFGPLFVTQPCYSKQQIKHLVKCRVVPIRNVILFVGEFCNDINCLT